MLISGCQEMDLIVHYFNHDIRRLYSQINSEIDESERESTLKMMRELI